MLGHVCSVLGSLITEMLPFQTQVYTGVNSRSPPLVVEGHVSCPTVANELFQSVSRSTVPGLSWHWLSRAAISCELLFIAGTHGNLFLLCLPLNLNFSKNILLYDLKRASLVAQLGKNLPAMQETWVRSLGWEDTLEKRTATHCNILAWRIPWTV